MTSYKIKDDVLAQQVADEMVILEPEHGNYYTVNGVGASMIAMLREAKSLSEITQNIANQYEVEEQTAKADYLELLEKLKAEGLVEAC
ncbi:PqqD family protein [Salinimonas marina]|uniref:PqqD family protein n=1 Tax=Salinimonas marina TaxID=2785918 RepID=A0A7S9HD35_9ALTE|nr:PqqD family protein [Salinimonas marina]QPG05146.1 PqqD family protein [Salinimonas marina]